MVDEVNKEKKEIRFYIILSILDNHKICPNFPICLLILVITNLLPVQNLNPI